MIKSYPMFAVFLCFVFASCSKKDGETIPIVNEPSKNLDLVVVGKKGVDFNTENTNGTWYNNVYNLKSHWFYTWGINLPFQQKPLNTEYVPMFWGKGSVTDASIMYVKDLKTQGRAKYILGFNEPDLTDQANMSVQEALLLWPKLESIGLPLGSPATSWPTRQWLYDFMDQAIAQNRRVDFIAVHMYVGTDDVHFIQVLQDLYNKYRKPIWITEFATSANDAKSMAENPYTPEMVQNFMQRLLPKLEALSFVHRYSWFSGSPTSSRLWSSSLVNANGTMTSLGKWYADYQPNQRIAKP
ncbi:glycosyl hydrolase [Pedobacter lithocola]|uniref:Glycosyl hydrolase n=1 Tax=Pedobacter lithocola TaxID=1908239 RepID=A0ABV8PE00_9SPHI